MRFFRLIPLPKLFVACILAFSATSTQAQNFFDSLKKEGNLVLDSFLDFFYYIGVLETDPKLPLYRFLEEAKTNKGPELELPTPEIAAILAEHTKSPVKESYLGYLKLHNETVSDRWRDAICWEKIILRIHDDSKVTGWAIKDSGKSTYRTYQVSEDITDAFCGEESDNSRISYKFVTKAAKEPTGGYSRCNLAWDSSRKVLSGKWEGGSSVNKMVSPADQQGNIHIDMHQHRYSDAFDINQNTIDTFSKNTNWNEESIKRLLSSVSKEPISDENLKLIITWYVVQAWNAYEEHLPQYLKNEKNTILNFRVCLKPQFYSGDKIENGKPKEVPAQFGPLDSTPAPRYYELHISTKKFFEIAEEEEYKFRSLLSIIGHEILGHGIFSRYYEDFIKNQSNTLDSSRKAETEKLNSLNENTFSSYSNEVKFSSKTAIQEGLAVAVEYSIYKRSGTAIPTSGILDFVKMRYIKEHGVNAANYELGVKYLKGLGIIKDNGELDFEKLKELNKPANKN